MSSGSKKLKFIYEPFSERTFDEGLAGIFHFDTDNKNSIDNLHFGVIFLPLDS